MNDWMMFLVASRGSIAGVKAGIELKQFEIYRWVKADHQVEVHSDCVNAAMHASRISHTFLQSLMGTLEDVTQCFK